MAIRTKDQLRSYNDSNITDNNSGEITGPIHNTMNRDIIDSMATEVFVQESIDAYKGEEAAAFVALTEEHLPPAVVTSFDDGDAASVSTPSSNRANGWRFHVNYTNRFRAVRLRFSHTLATLDTNVEVNVWNYNKTQIIARGISYVRNPTGSNDVIVILDREVNLRSQDITVHRTFWIGYQTTNAAFFVSIANQNLDGENPTSIFAGNAETYDSVSNVWTTSTNRDTFIQFYDLTEITGVRDIMQDEIDIADNVNAILSRNLTFSGSSVILGVNTITPEALGSPYSGWGQYFTPTSPVSFNAINLRGITRSSGVPADRIWHFYEVIVKRRHDDQDLLARSGKISITPSSLSIPDTVVPLYNDKMTRVQMINTDELSANEYFVAILFFDDSGEQAAYAGRAVGDMAGADQTGTFFITSPITHTNWTPSTLSGSVVFEHRLLTGVNLSRELPGVSQEEVRNIIGTTLVNGVNTTVVVNANGTVQINAQAGGGGDIVQSDWNETDVNSNAFILNKPDLSNLQSDWNETDVNSNAFILNKPDLSEEALMDLLAPNFISNEPISVVYEDGNNVVRISLTIGSEVDEFMVRTAANGFGSTGIMAYDRVNNRIQIGNSSVATDTVMRIQGNVEALGTFDGRNVGADGLKLDGIEEGAEANVQADWDVTDGNSDAFIRNKPNFTGMQPTGDIGSVQVRSNAGTFLGVDVMNYDIDNVRIFFGPGTPQTTDFFEINGSVRIIGTLNGVSTQTLFNKIDGIEEGAEVNVQADWNVTDSNSDAFILNKPVVPVVSGSIGKIQFSTGAELGSNSLFHFDNTNVRLGIGTGQPFYPLQVLGDIGQFALELDNAQPRISFGDTTNQRRFLSIIGRDLDDVILSASNGDFILSATGETGQDIVISGDNGNVRIGAGDFIGDEKFRVNGNVVIGGNITSNNITQISAKLANIEDGANVNVQADWNVIDTNSDAFIRNKPTIPVARTDEDIRDVIVAMLREGSNITLTENDEANTLTISSSANISVTADTVTPTEDNLLFRPYDYGFFYTYSSLTAATPEAKQIRFNNTSIPSATQAYLHHQDNIGNRSPGNLISTGDRIIVAAASGDSFTSTYFSFNVTSSSTSNNVTTLGLALIERGPSTALLTNGVTYVKVIRNSIFGAQGGGGGSVDSVFGRTGAVAAQTGDYNTGQVTENATNRYFRTNGFSFLHNLGTDLVPPSGGIYLELDADPRVSIHQTDQYGDRSAVLTAGNISSGDVLEISALTDPTFFIRASVNNSPIPLSTGLLINITILQQSGSLPAANTPIVTRVIKAQDIEIVSELKTITATTYTLVLADENKYLRGISSAPKLFTVPPESSVAFPINTEVHIRRAGSGALTIIAGAGVTINSSGALSLRSQHSTATLKKIAANEWDLIGDLNTA